MVPEEENYQERGTQNYLEPRTLELPQKAWDRIFKRWGGEVEGMVGRAKRRQAGGSRRSGEKRRGREEGKEEGWWAWRKLMLTHGNPK